MMCTEELKQTGQILKKEKDMCPNTRPSKEYLDHKIMRADVIRKIDAMLALGRVSFEFGGSNRYLAMLYINDLPKNVGLGETYCEAINDLWFNYIKSIVKNCPLSGTPDALCCKCACKVCETMK